MSTEINEGGGILSIAEENKQALQDLKSKNVELKESEELDVLSKINQAKNSTKNQPAILQELAKRQESAKNLKIERVKEFGEDGETIQSQNNPVQAQSSHLEGKKGETTVKLFDIMFSRLCAIMAGEKNSGEFRMDKEELKDFAEMAQVHVDSGGWLPDTQIMMITMFLIHVAGSLKKANEMRLAKKKKPNQKTLKPPQKSVAEKVAEKVKEVEQEKKFDYSHLKEVETGRKKFDLTPTGGFYKYSPEGKYLKKSAGEWIEKPSKEILELKEKNFSNSDIYKTINAK